MLRFSQAKEIIKSDHIDSADLYNDTPQQKKTVLNLIIHKSGKTYTPGDEIDWSIGESGKPSPLRRGLKEREERELNEAGDTERNSNGKIERELNYFSKKSPQ